MEIRNGEVVSYDGDPMLIKDHPVSVEIIRISNSGSWYNPPTSHLGLAVNSRHPVSIAELGLNFYEKFVDDTEKKFWT